MIILSNLTKKHCEQFKLKKVLIQYQTRQSQISDSALSLVLPPGESLWVYVLFTLPIPRHYAQTWSHPQNRKYITYRIAARVGRSHWHHVHGNLVKSACLVFETWVQTETYMLIITVTKLTVSLKESAHKTATVKIFNQQASWSTQLLNI